MSIAPATSASASSTAGRQRPVWFWPALGLGVAVVLLIGGYFLAGPRAETLPTVYGKRRGDGARSVSGTSVLTDLFKEAGHRTTTLTRLSPRLEKWDVVVWAPDDFAPPTKEQREFLENWLTNGSGRVVVYIGRDHDAAVAYWEKVQATPNPDNPAEVQRQLARAKADYASQRAKMPPEEYACWFTARRDGTRRRVDALQGPWAEGVDAKKADIRLEGRLDIPVPADVGTSDSPLPENIEKLLESDGDVLATRLTDSEWGDGEVIVLTNGSFVLNYPLVNHEHRKLAARLIEECGADETKKVVFIESGPGGPPVLEKEPTGGDTSPLAFLNVWPLNAIVLHLTILGIVFCLARSPIFGRPRDLPGEPAADFGKHVAALGELLARTQDRNYAQSRLGQYRETGKRKSGKSHLQRK